MKTGKIKIISYDNRARLFWVMTTISVLSLFVYIYSINNIARNIAVRQTLEKQITHISTNLDSLEFAYIELKNNVTLELAYHHGFKEIKDPLYVSRDHGTALSFNTLDR